MLSMDEPKNSPWTPPGMGEEQLEAFLAFKDGFPAGMIPLIQKWLQAVIAYPGKTAGGYVIFDASVFLDFQLRMNKSFGWPVKDAYYEDQFARCLAALRPQELVYFVDFVLAQERHGSRREGELESILLNGRSNWSIGRRDGRPGLIGRVPSAVAEVIETTTDKPGKANNLLRRAWAQAYGVTPDAPASYSSAVKAVEVYSTKIFSPKTDRSTLGKDIAAFRAKPEKWTFNFGNHDSDNQQHLLGMMSLLWNNQSDRHGSENYQDVSVEQARAAVLLASTLVGWFDQGLVELKEEYRN